MKTKRNMIISMILLVVLFAAPLWAAGKTEAASGTGAEDEVTNIVVYYYGSNNQVNQDKVIAAMNEYSKEKIGVTIEFHAFANSEYKDKLSMDLAAKTDIDLCWMASYTNMSSLCNEDALMDLTDIIPQYEDLYNVMPEKIWKSTEFEKKMYYVPNYKESFISYSVITPVEMADTVKAKYGIDFSEIQCSSIREIGNYESYILACMQEGVNIPIPGLINYQKWIASDDRYDLIEIPFVMNKETHEVSSYFDTPEYEEYVALMKHWNDLGIRVEEPLMSDFKDTPYWQSGKYAIGGWSTVPDNQNAASTRYNVPVYLNQATNLYLTSGTAIGSGWSVTNYSKKADACMKWLTLLNTDTEFADMFMYGLEGENYKVEENGTITLIPDTGWKNSAWRATNFKVLTLLSTDAPDKKEQYETLNEQAIPTASLGFQPDTSAVSGEISAINAVISEHQDMLNYGFYSVEDLAKIRASLKAAGSDKVVAELQKQIDEFFK